METTWLPGWMTPFQPSIDGEELSPVRPEG
jgi:hypothetical protein